MHELRDGTDLVASTDAAPHEDLHEWVSFEDPDEDRTWVFDLTFLTSNWTCLYGARLSRASSSEPAPELEHGCCSYGAHFTGEEDRAQRRGEGRAARARTSGSSPRRRAKRGGPIFVNKDGETVSRVVDGACVFLNRPDHPGGAGLRPARRRPPPGRVDHRLEARGVLAGADPPPDETDVYGHVTSTVREWKRRDWGPGGEEFHWWCTRRPRPPTPSSATSRCGRRAVRSSSP